MSIDVFQTLVQICETPTPMASFMVGLGSGGGGMGVLWWKAHLKERVSKELLWRLCTGRVASPSDLPKYLLGLEKKVEQLKQECVIRARRDKRRRLDLVERDRTILELQKRIEDIEATTPQIEEMEKVKGERDGAERRIKELEAAVDSISNQRHVLVADNDRLKQRCGSLENDKSHLEAKLHDERTKSKTDTEYLKASLAQRNKEVIKFSDELKLVQYDLAKRTLRVNELERLLEAAVKPDEAARQQLERRNKEIHDLEIDRRKLQDERSKLSQRTSEQAAEIAELKKGISHLNVELNRLRVEVRNEPSPINPDNTNVVLEIDRIWDVQVSNSDQELWTPRAKRGCPIISILNLKGGVGKTTVTANLGATRWMNGQKVLMLDLDFQGTLTARCLSSSQEERMRTRGSAHDFFNSIGGTAKELKDKVVPITLSAGDGYKEQCI